MKEKSGAILKKVSNCANVRVFLVNLENNEID